MIKTPADLTKLIDLCRKKGVTSIKLSENLCEMTLGQAPDSPYRQKKNERELEALQSSYSEEDALFWSSTAESGAQ